jgi:ribosomal protein S18 acetylase RimI-like enzyme
MSHDTTPPVWLSPLAEETFVDGYADQLDRDLLTRYAREVYVPELLAEVTAGASELLLAHDHGRAVGYATVRQVRTPSRPTARVDRLYVCADQQRRGHGRRLMESAMTLARAWAAARLCLGVWERNERALAFYEAMGFAAHGEEAFDLLGAVQRDVVMCRSLAR